MSHAGDAGFDGVSSSEDKSSIDLSCGSSEMSWSSFRRCIGDLVGDVYEK